MYLMWCDGERVEKVANFLLNFSQLNKANGAQRARDVQQNWCDVFKFLLNFLLDTWGQRARSTWQRSYVVDGKEPKSTPFFLFYSKT
jgi:hypothetical protein